MIKIKITGLDELEELYKKAPERVLKETNDALKESASIIVNNTVKQLKEKKINNQGKLAQSVDFYPSGKLKVVVEVDSDYAAAVEKGTRPHTPPIKPLKDWSRRKLGNEKLAFLVQRKIKRKGTPPRWYFRDAITKSVPDIEERFNQIFINVFK